MRSAATTVRPRSVMGLGPRYVNRQLHRQHREAITALASYLLLRHSWWQAPHVHLQLESLASGPSSQMDRPTCKRGSCPHLDIRTRGHQINTVRPQTHTQHPRHQLTAQTCSITHSPLLDAPHALEATLFSPLPSTLRSVPPLWPRHTVYLMMSPCHSILHAPHVAQHRVHTTSALALHLALRLHRPPRISSPAPRTSHAMSSCRWYRPSLTANRLPQCTTHHLHTSPATPRVSRWR